MKDVKDDGAVKRQRLSEIMKRVCLSWAKKKVDSLSRYSNATDAIGWMQRHLADRKRRPSAWQEKWTELFQASEVSHEDYQFLLEACKEDLDFVNFVTTMALSVARGEIKAERSKHKS